MSRSKWKGPYINLKNFNINSKKQQNNIAFRNSEIIPKFLGVTYRVHDGKNYSEFTVIEEMIGHKFGEFAFTRKKFVFKKKKLKK